MTMVFKNSMDEAVVIWKMANDQEYRTFATEIASISQKSHLRQAKELLVACESLDPIDIYQMVKEMKPSAYVIADLVILAKKSQKTITAKTAASNKNAKDPKQVDKTLVRECWDEWQKQLDRYKGKAAFARDMRDKFPNLESQPVIEGWCRLWERES